MTRVQQRVSPWPAIALVVVFIIIIAFAVLALTHSLPTSTVRATMGTVDPPNLSSSPAPNSIFIGVNYCNDGNDGGQQTLDIYYPATPISNNPVVIFVHGGGWKSGDSSGIETWFRDGLLNEGIVVASINYRLAPQFLFPAQQYDAQCAVAFFRQNAAKLGTNPNEIGISGNSAGGQIASWVAVNQTAAYRVQAVGVISAPEDLSNSYGDTTFSTAVSMAFPTALDRGEGSPVNFVSNNSPPFLLEQGYNDTIVPYQQAVEMYNALTRVGALATLILVDNAGHGLVPVDSLTPNPPPPETQQAMLQFFQRWLG